MNLEIVERIVALMDAYPVSEITVEQGGQRVSVRKPLSPAAPPAPFPPTKAAAAADTGPIVIETALEDEAPADKAFLLAAPMVGIFHHTDPPVRYGATLAAEQVVGSIESMKLMNDVTADSGGQVAEVLIEDGAPVEYGQALFRLSSP